MPPESVAILLALACVAVLPAQPPADAGSKPKPGYTDTPLIPGSRWRVHDAERPRPPVVEPPTPSSDAQPGKPPSDAIVLFDGTDLSAWKGRGGEARWKIVDGAMEVNGTGDIETREHFGDCQLHIEWCAPREVKGNSQDRGNSGVYFMGRYEVQVLDSRDNETYADGQAAAIYGQFPPLVNACRKPGEWQTYDIVFEAPHFADGKLVKPARVTVFHNGVLVHHARELLGAAAHRQVARYTEHPPEGPLRLQDHGNPVRFRNVWIRRLDRTEDGGAGK
ncbi:MAG TPA: DUF1080 domain-containing protein [Planctomycetota bacterium]|nr:DUF1080 domain-containing protein [Planctomycetota bacterium]